MTWMMVWTMADGRREKSNKEASSHCWTYSVMMDNTNSVLHSLRQDLKKRRGGGGKEKIGKVTVMKMVWATATEWMTSLTTVGGRKERSKEEATPPCRTSPGEAMCRLN